MPEPESAQRAFARHFWDDKAIHDTHHAIWADERPLDPEAREQAFAESGVDAARLLAEFVTPIARVVDLGCGIGRVMRELAPLCREILGVDISEEMLKRGQDYLSGVSNVNLLQTDGASLEGIESDSVDFLYSMMCLIHVDRRSAYRYLVETKRVLKPDGRALLDFLDLASPEGLESFIDVTEKAYPLEFYTLEELRILLGSAGLEVIGERRNKDLLRLVVLNGSLDRFVQRLKSSLSSEIISREGFFQGGVIRKGLSGTLRARLQNASDDWQTVRAIARIAGTESGPEEVWLEVDGVFYLEPEDELELVCTYDGDAETFRFVGNGKPAVMGDVRKRSPLQSGKVRIRVAALPSGFTGEDTLRLFPHLMTTTDLELRA